MDPSLLLVPLHTVAHALAGDKGNRLNVSLICYRPEVYPHLAEQVSEAAVAALFASRRPSAVKRYDLPGLGAFNFVLDDVLDGGVNNSLCLDKHGKGLSFLLLSLQVRIPRHLVSPTTASREAMADAISPA
jgi:hypothetical protein